MIYQRVGNCVEFASGKVSKTFKLTEKEVENFLYFENMKKKVFLENRVNIPKVGKSLKWSIEIFFLVE